MKLCKGSVGYWDDKSRGNWDQAVKNSSCLRAAILRALKLEVGVLSQLDTAAILWGIIALFDSIRTIDVMAFGLEHEFPPIILRLALLCHCGPRAYKERAFVGPWLLVTGLSIIAGCGSLVSITRYGRKYAGSDVVSSMMDAKASMMKMKSTLCLELTRCLVFSHMNDVGLLSAIVKQQCRPTDPDRHRKPAPTPSAL